ncbi:hypothetical protein [Dyadobacter chenhuakuii]|uniref:Uncharacterized protein n=1 Tax=Dyadobacter chenhuakuii TaxID=2909339 RepID=A0A9X1QBD2_9BACT|nr:hypothetical protein [Dyadobacter chenhuakuii]MCF2496714.1 hypothetical protein [Dyadobacter chenhuakuii]
MSSKSNYGFEVHINGEQLCKAGIDADRHVVTCILTSLRRVNEPDELDLTVSGLNSVTGQHPGWIDKELKEGDTITIKVITEGFEPARRIRPKLSEEKILDNKLRYYHQLREELKEYLE